MRSLYGLKITETCSGCQFCTERLFHNLPSQALHAFDALKSANLYPKGAALFVEGQSPRGIYVLCGGHAKLTAGSGDGKEVIVRLAEPGEILGLSATLSGEPYHLTAETIEPCQADFVRRDDFLRFLREQPEVCFRVVEMLSGIIRSAHTRLRCFGGIHSASERLADLLLCWLEQMGEETEEGIRLKIKLTHQEIAQAIGASRETVTRLMGQLKRQQIITVDDSGLLVRDKAALAAKAGHRKLPAGANE